MCLNCVAEFVFQGYMLNMFHTTFNTGYFISNLDIHIRHVAKSKNLGGQVVMRRAAPGRRHLLICQNLGGQLPPLPPPLQHACIYMNELQIQSNNRRLLGA